MTNRCSAVLVVLSIALCVADLAKAQQPPESHPTEIVLSMPEPPEGFVVSKYPLELEGKVVGYHVQVISEESFSKIVVQIETGYDRTPRAARVAALKGYVNGLANGFKDAGYRITGNKVPDLKQANFDEPQTVEMQFRDENDDRLLVRQLIFFTDKGFNVQILARNQSELDRLSDWARHIKPAKLTVE